jgi:hypothetical protein
MTTENQSKPLTIIEKSLLKKLILDEPKRPTSYKFSGIYRLFDYETTSENSVKEAVNNLVQLDYLQEDKGYFSLTRETFLQLKQKYRILLLLNSRNSTVAIAASIGLIASVATIIPEFGNWSKSDNEKSEIVTKDNVEVRINNIESKLAAYDSNYISNASKLDSASFARNVVELNSKYTKLSDNFNSLNSLLQDNPTKFIEIATLKRDIDDIKKQISSNDESLKREVDKISSYNNTLIVFMITFLVAYIGIGVFNFITRNKSTSL